MHKALNETLGSLPDDTKVFVSCPRPLREIGRPNAISQPGHEYTKSNVKFGLSVLQSEAVKALDAFAASNLETQGKFTIGDEKVRSSYHAIHSPNGKRRETATNASMIET